MRKGEQVHTIGIDLGTTYSAVATVTPAGVVEVLQNEEGELLTASTVYFASSGDVQVGRAAKERSSLEPDRVVSAIKRQMGRDRVLTFEGCDYRPEAISAIILRWVAQSAAEELGIGVEELAAVITVPAYFGVAEREATAAASNIAGLTCIDLVAEPVAAALSYAMSSDETGVVLVYDLGGGTFDATVLRLSAAGPVVVAVDGSNELGGLNFDERLHDLLVERYVAATSDADARDDEGFLLQIEQKAEGLKKTLSRAESGSVLVERGRTNARISLSREEFEASTVDLLAESISVVDRVIASAARLGTGRPDRVVLVGGSTRMPMVKQRLADHLGVPVRVSEPDLAVAKGAAIHAQALLNQRDSPPQAALGTAGGSAHRLATSQPVRSVVARALGIKLIDSHDSTGSRTFVSHIIPANTPLPVNGARARFATVMTGQERTRIELMEQSGAVASPELAHNRRVLDGELSGLPERLPAGSPIDITLLVGMDGRIRCVAVEPSSGRELVLESYMDGVSDDAELNEQKAVVTGLRFVS